MHKVPVQSSTRRKHQKKDDPGTIPKSPNYDQNYKVTYTNSSINKGSVQKLLDLYLCMYTF